MGCTQSSAIAQEPLKQADSPVKQKQTIAVPSSVKQTIHIPTQQQNQQAILPQNKLNTIEETSVSSEEKKPETETKKKEVNSDFKPIGYKAGIEPLPKQTTLLVKEKLFSGDSFHIKTLPNREPYNNGLHIKGKRFTRREEMALLDGTGQILAVCMQKFDMAGKVFKVCVPEPVFPGQVADEVFERQAMYTYCLVKHVPFHNGEDVYMAGARKANDPPAYEIRRVGGLGPRKLVVKKRGLGSPVAFVEGHMLNANPGSDPCLMICFSAISDEMEDDGRGRGPGGMIERDMRRDMRREIRGGGRRGRW